MVLETFSFLNRDRERKRRFGDREDSADLCFAAPQAIEKRE